MDRSDLGSTGPAALLREPVPPDEGTVAVWEWRRGARRLLPVDRCGMVRGLPAREALLEDWLGHVDPADRDTVAHAFDAAARVPSRLDIRFRTVSTAGETVWLHARDLHAEAHLDRDRASPILLRDVTAERAEAVRNDILFAEIVHRTRNMFGLVAALARISARGAETPAEMAEALGDRLAALERVHALIEPTRSRAADRAVPLDALLATLLAPYRAPGPADRISIDTGPAGPIEIGPGARSALALVVHELAAHSTRHGALAGPAGTLAITAQADDEALRLAWSEHLHDPQAGGDPGGLRMAETMARLLSGTIEFERHPHGLLARLAVPASRLRV